MRTLELRLDALNYGLGDRRDQMWLPSGSYTSAEAARLMLALEFFDRALVQGMSGCLDPAPHSGGDVPGKIFQHASALTLLRFGVRIVGLDENSRQDAQESTIDPDSPQPTDPETTEPQSGAEWPKTLAWEEESAVLVTEPAVAHEIDRRWSEEPKLRNRIERAEPHLRLSEAGRHVLAILRGEV